MLENSLELIRSGEKNGRLHGAALRLALGTAPGAQTAPQAQRVNFQLGSVFAHGLILPRLGFGALPARIVAYSQQLFNQTRKLLT